MLPTHFSIAHLHCQVVYHRSEKKLGLKYPHAPEVTAFLRLSFPELKWSKTLRMWLLPYSPSLTKELIEYSRGKIWIDLKTPSSNRLETNPLKKKPKKPSEWLKVALSNFEDKLRMRRYSENTIQTYSDCIKTFYIENDHLMPEETTTVEVENFFTDYLIQRKLSWSYQNQFINALKLFLSIIPDGQIIEFYIKRPKSPSPLPKVLSAEQITKLLAGTSNIKHKTMLSLLYACGLRSGELINLRISDIDKDRLTLTVHEGKGKKDRVLPISSNLLNLLRVYYRSARTVRYLFEGQEPGTKYSPRSLALVMKQALLREGLEPRFTLHTLRHSYATHLLESGVNLRIIQELLGHRSSKTTEIYTHVSTESFSKIPSPFDRLNLKI
ncbi:MAG: site-specific integrase [Bacteroidetes bacterium]|nr:site-specific integrase [Bacteroidota bacterium]